MNNPPLYIVGVDLGQSADFTALCVLERTQVDTGRRVESTIPGGRRPPEVVYEHHYLAGHLDRLAIGTPYPKQVEHVKALFDRLKADTKRAPLLVVDATGVGAPVVDMLRAAGLTPVAVTITGGTAVTRSGLNYHVPKRDLISAAQVLLQTRRLKVISSLREAQTLVSELQAFKVSVGLSGRDTYGNDVGSWRENAHDDLVLAVAMASWFGEHYRPAVDNTPPSLSFRGSRYSGRR